MQVYAALRNMHRGFTSLAFTLLDVVDEGLGTDSDAADVVRLPPAGAVILRGPCFVGVVRIVLIMTVQFSPLLGFVRIKLQHTWHTWDASEGSADRLVVELMVRAGLCYELVREQFVRLYSLCVYFGTI